ncbi:hypothetical protein ACFQ0T_34435 [Kitasatospora gansuensis]
MGHSLQEQVVRELQRRAEPGRTGGRGAAADVQLHVRVGQSALVRRAERPDGQRHRLAPAGGRGLGEGVAELARDGEPDGAGGEFGAGDRLGGGGPVQADGVAPVEGAPGLGQRALADRGGQGVVVGGAGGPVGGGVDCALGGGLALVGEDQADQVAAGSGRAAAAAAVGRARPRRQHRLGAVGEAAAQRPVGTDRERRALARVQFAGGALDQAPVGQRGERVEVQREQVGPVHRPSRSATKAAS